MTTGLRIWSKTAATNNSVDSNINWAEGMAPSAVNNSARAQMASAAKWRDDNSGTLVTSGSTTAYTVTSNQVSTGYLDGDTIAVTFHAANDSSATLNVDSVGAKQIQLIPGTNLSGGEFQGGTSHRFHYSSSSTAWIAQGSNLLGSSAVATANIANSAVTYAKIQNEAAGTILGNGSTASAALSEITVGSGLVLSATSLTAPAFPPQGVFKKLAIKTASTTTINGSADFVTLATSGSSAFITIPASGTINMASTGVANGLDTGALAGSTFYAIWAIAVTSTSTHADLLASTSFTTPLMPSTYTFKARIGAQVTTTTTGTAALHGVYQFGRKAQYVSGLAGTTVSPVISSGLKGTYDNTSPSLTSIDAAWVPTTASAIHIQLSNVYKNGTAASAVVAPSTAWGGSQNGILGSNGQAFPAFVNGGLAGYQVTDWMVLESTSIAIAASAAGAGLSCLGWEDNI